MAVWLGLLSLACVANAFYLPGLAPAHYCEKENVKDGCVVSYQCGHVLFAQDIYSSTDRRAGTRQIAALLYYVINKAASSGGFRVN